MDLSSTLTPRSGPGRRPEPWLSRWQRPILTLTLLAMVGYLAYYGDEQAQAAIVAAFSVLVGHIFGERAALKQPGKDV